MVFRVWKIVQSLLKKRLPLDSLRTSARKPLVLTCHSLLEDHSDSFGCTEFPTASAQPQQQEELTESDTPKRLVCLPTSKSLVITTATTTKTTIMTIKEIDCRGKHAHATNFS